MSLIVDLIRPELIELSALELEKSLLFDFVNLLASTNTCINHSAPNFVTMYTVIRAWMSLIMIVYSLASANKDQSAPNLVKIYMSIRSRVRSIMVPIGFEQLE